MSNHTPNKLFAYGTLLPNRSNEHWLKNIGGTFTPAKIRAKILPDGWGLASGYPAILVDDGQGWVDGMVFESADLPNHWQALDDFEGAGYRRELVTVQVADEQVQAWAYVLNVSDEQKSALLVS